MIKETIRTVHSAAKLPDSVLPAIHAVCQQARSSMQHYADIKLGNKASLGGLQVLFCGTSDAVKSLAATAIAQELQRELLHIDLSTIVSKYIGETEKHLDSVFADAQASGAILFFDEADALFGKRSEVKDAHDRYANLDVNYLLQRIEQYQGIAILTTNKRENIDAAFLRNLRHVIDLP